MTTGLCHLPVLPASQQGRHQQTADATGHPGYHGTAATTAAGGQAGCKQGPVESVDTTANHITGPGGVCCQLGRGEQHVQGEAQI